MVEEVFASLPKSFHPAAVTKPKVYYFSIGEVKKTVTLGTDAVKIEDGKTVAEADCVCKTDEAFFLKIWNEGYLPGMADFLSGKIKSNNPVALKEFLAAFGKGI